VFENVFRRVRNEARESSIAVALAFFGNAESSYRSSNVRPAIGCCRSLCMIGSLRIRRTSFLVAATLPSHSSVGPMPIARSGITILMPLLVMAGVPSPLPKHGAKPIGRWCGSIVRASAYSSHATLASVSPGIRREFAVL
jgi:hypothetical protein